MKLPLKSVVVALAIIFATSSLTARSKDSRTSATQSGSHEKTESAATESVKAANDKFYESLHSMFTGDMRPMGETWSHSDDVSLAGPFKGRLDGWKAVNEEFTKESKMGIQGRVAFEQPHIVASRDMGYAVGVEVSEQMTIGGKPMTVNQRATNIFRRENGTWKMVHHHTDLGIEEAKTADRK